MPNFLGSAESEAYTEDDSVKRQRRDLGGDEEFQKAKIVATVE